MRKHKKFVEGIFACALAACLFTACDGGGAPGPVTPTAEPTSAPVVTATPAPTAKPTQKPTATPTPKPTATPTPKPTATPAPTSTPQIVWTIEDLGNGKARLTGYDSTGATPKGNITLPTKVSGRTITEVKGGIFKDNDKIKSVTIPSTVCSINYDCAFWNCSNLKTVIFEEGTTFIGSSTFRYCSSLENIVLPQSLTTLERWSFTGCTALKQIVLPNKLSAISWHTFGDCTSLSKVYIPANIKKIESEAFQNCTSLTDVYYGGTEEQWLEISLDGSGNGYLTAANIHYNSTAADMK